MAEVGQEIISKPGGYAALIDEPTATTTYICLAAPGSSTASAVWRVMRIDTSTSNQTIITFADGNKNFDNVAANRASLSYS
jgi:hypothetical protein